MNPSIQRIVFGFLRILTSVVFFILNWMGQKTLSAAVIPNWDESYLSWGGNLGWGIA